MIINGFGIGISPPDGIFVIQGCHFVIANGTVTFSQRKRIFHSFYPVFFFSAGFPVFFNGFVIFTNVVREQGVLSHPAYTAGRETSNHQKKQNNPEVLHAHHSFRVVKLNYFF
jgi:hypothetical protein